jgi:hypothetical protein
MSAVFWAAIGAGSVAVGWVLGYLTAIQDQRRRRACRRREVDRWVRQGMTTVEEYGRPR